MRHPAAGGRRSGGHVAPDRIGILAGGRHLDGSALATLVPTLALLPISLVALAAFWFPVSLLVPIPYWLFAVVYLGAGVLLCLRPVQQLLLRWLFGARRPQPAELRRLRPVWDDVVRQAGFPKDRFVLAVVDSDELNAFACGGHVVATSTAALALLPDDELHGVLAHELVDIFKLPQRRPIGVALAPVRARREPDSERLGEILVRMALRVPAPQVLHVAAAGRIGSVVFGIRPRRAAEQFAPALAPVQCKRALHHVPCFVT